MNLIDGGVQFEEMKSKGQKKILNDILKATTTCNIHLIDEYIN